METFHSLISKITCSKSDSEMVLALNNFQRNISAEICKQNNQSSDILISEFVKIWNCFLNLPYRDRTNVKLALHSALSAFLFRLTPYFPEEIKMSFEMVSMNDTLDENSSILRISSFVFIMNFISLEFLNDYLQSIAIFHHFVTSEALNSEYISFILDGIDNVGKTWLRTLLFAMLKQYEQKENRSILKAILSVVRKDPEQLMKELSTVDRSKKTFTLASFLISSLGNLINNLDIYNFAYYAIEVLNSKDRLYIDEENAFQVLSSLSNSFELNISKLEKTIIEIKLSKKEIADNSKGKYLSSDEIKKIIDNYDKKNKRKEKLKYSNQNIDEEDIEEFNYMENIYHKQTTTIPLSVTIQFDYSCFLERPSFYLLPLPIEMLIPKKTDSIQIFTTKVQSIGKIFKDSNSICDVEIIVELLDQFCTYKYDQYVSACCILLSICVNTLILNSKSYKLKNILERIIFTKKIESWFHGNDILRIIQSLNMNLVPYVFGKNGFSKIISVLLSFSLNKNEKFANNSIEEIIKIATSSNIEKIQRKIIEKIDFFDSYSLQINLHILTFLNQKIKTKNQIGLSFFISSIIEISSFYFDDIKTMTSIFGFLSTINSKYIDIKSLSNLIDLSSKIIKIGIQVLAGKPKKNNNQEFYDIIQKYVYLEMGDIITKQLNSNNYTFINYPLKFLFNLPFDKSKSDFFLNICEKTFNFYPEEVTKFLYNNFENYEQEKIIELIKKLKNILVSVKSIDVHSKWCDFLIKLHVFQSDFGLDDLINKLKNTSIFFLQNYSKTLTIDEMLSFSRFLVYENKRNKRFVFQFILSLSFNKRKSFYQKKSNRLHKFFKYIPNENYSKTSQEKTFEDMGNYQKLIFIKNYLDFSKFSRIKFPRKIIDFGNKELNGWDLVYFKLITGQQEVSNETCYSFNPLYKKEEFFIDDFDFLKKNNEFIDFSSHSISLSKYPQLVKLLNEKGKDISQIFNFSLNDLETSLKDTMIEAIIADQDKFLNLFNVDDPLKKKYLCSLSIALSQVSSVNNMIIDIIIKQLINTSSEKRIIILINLLCVIIDKLPQLPKNLVQAIYKWLSSLSYIPPHAFLMFKIMSFKTSFTNDTIKIMNTVQKTTIPTYFNHYTYLIFKITKSIGKKSLHPYIGLCLSIEQPSYLLNTYNILKNVSEMLSSSISLYIFNSFLQDLLKKYIDFPMNPYVSESFSLFCISLLSNESLSSMHNYIASIYLSQILPQPSSPNSYLLLEIIYYIINSSSINSKVSNGYFAFSEKLVRHNQYEYFLLFIRIVELHISRTKDLLRKQELLENAVYQWLEVQNNFNSYDLLLYLNKLIDLMRLYIPIRSLATIYSFQFLKLKTSFLPLFVGFSQVYKYVLSDAIDEERLSIIDILRNAPSVVSDPNHSRSLTLLLEDKREEALRLALT